MIKKTVLLLLTFAMLSFSEATPEETYSLTVKSVGFRNSEGEILFALYNKDGSIPDEKYKNYFKKGVSQIDKNGTATFIFTDLPKGSYAVNILHDENKNGKIDKKFLLPIPSEGIGFSNYESIGMSDRPNFSKASFLVKSDMEKVIKVIYL
ncbi:DUF2141 domain-containing protein [Desulfotignum phosphitoxidans]|uniref:DUF2141 domain-containing protein n=1 Tax=Desulfotignum phosphitoxidans DSM 13687 TaxID=1286635 RepID=S0FWA0_9BACT|nr:DUF2141 domain-containing protein [Desulfotignum phosphitoxidans]EMS77414.1 hypothetical protein, DUF2141 [Desulfotignum phosphitoxidans DSM 13687]